MYGERIKGTFYIRGESQNRFAYYAERGEKSYWTPNKNEAMQFDLAHAYETLYYVEDAMLLLQLTPLQNVNIVDENGKEVPK